MPKIQILSSEADYFSIMENREMYLETLLKLKDTVEDLQDYESLIWTASHLADLYSFQGKHNEATQVLAEMAPDPQEPLVTATRAMLLRRRHLHAAAIAEFQTALDSPRLEARDHLRSLLHMADSQSKNGDPDGAGASLKMAMEGLLASRELILFSPDIRELSDLVQHAILDPELAPYMELLLERFAVLHGKDAKPASETIHLRVQTLGRAAVFHNGEEVRFSLNGCVLTLVYLALFPSSSRKELEATLYPERGGKAAGDYFRAVFRELRVKLGQAVLWLDGSPKSPRYRLGPSVYVDLDMQHLREALRQGDTARALSLYRGPFLPDSKMESDWVDDTREELRQGVFEELRLRLEQARDSGDLRRALLLTNQYLKIDPEDIEMLTDRVDLARQVAPPQDVARYTVELQRQVS